MNQLCYSAINLTYFIFPTAALHIRILKVTLLDLEKCKLYLIAQIVAQVFLKFIPFNVFLYTIFCLYLLFYSHRFLLKNIVEQIDTTEKNLSRFVKLL